MAAHLKMTYKEVICYCCFAVVFLCGTTFTSAQNNSQNHFYLKLKKLERAKSFTPTDTTYINLLNDIAGELRFVHSDTMLVFAKRALANSKKAAYDRGKARSHKYIGDYFSDHGQSAKAIEHYRNALVISRETKNIDHELRLMNDLALEYQYTGKFSKSLNLFLDAIDLAQSNDNDTMLSILNENLAGMYTDQKDYDQALEFYEKVKKINSRIGNEIFSAETMSNVASLYADMEDFELAMFNVNQSISVFEKHKIYDWLAYAYNVKGKIYLKQQKFKWALYWYDQAALLHQRLDDERGKMELYHGFSEVYFELEEDSLSSKYANMSYAIAKSLASLEGQRDGAETLFKIYKKNGDFETALAYHEIFQQVSDSLSTDENRNSLTLLKTKIKHEKQKQDIIIANDKAMAKQRNYIYATLIILIILLSTAIPLYFNQKKLVRLFKELKLKTRALKRQEVELMKLDKTKNQLFSIIGHDLRGPIGGLQGILRLFTNKEMTQREFLKHIPKLKTDVDHILFSLNNLLSWGQSQLKNNLVKPSIIPLKNNVEDSVNLLSEMAAVKNITLINKIPDSAYVWVDSNQLDVIVRNLISNAIKFTPENGTITIGATNNEEAWEIFVRDTGVGMSEDVSQRIFRSDEKVTTYGTNNEKGTGLGLSLCKEMVEKNNGIIWVESKLKKGTTFFFSIPKVNRQKFKKAS